LTLQLCGLTRNPAFALFVNLDLYGVTTCPSSMTSGPMVKNARVTAHYSLKMYPVQSWQAGAG
jgi:hypothetical protein